MSLKPNADKIEGVKSLTRKGKAIATYKGIFFYPLDPRSNEIDIEDIAHSLSLQCRYNGHSSLFYSVGDHSLRVSYICSPQNALYALLHDASEAYLCDIPSPIKYDMPDYLRYEKLLQDMIYKKYGLGDEPPDVKIADKVMLHTEMRDLMNITTDDPLYSPLNEKIIPLSPQEAEKQFLDRFEQLRKEHDKFFTPLH